MVSLYRRLALPVTCLIATLTVSPAAGQIRPDTLGSGLAWRVVPDTGSARVSGLVLTHAGVPLAEVLATVGDPGIGAITDHSGTFEVTLPAPGVWRIQFSQIGYHTVSDSLTVPPGHSVFVVAVLGAAEIPMCGLRVYGGAFRPDDLNISVVDAATGEVPTGMATVRVVHPASGSEHTSTSEIAPTGVVGLRNPITTWGLHTIEVRVPGYIPWRMENVHLWLLHDGCEPQLTNNKHTARLVRDPR